MNSLKIACILRDPEYSPNSIERDRAILLAVLGNLENLGYSTEIMEESQFLSAENDFDVIVNMCRKKESITKLKNLELNGKIVINSGFGIENCSRANMTEIFLRNNIPTAESYIIPIKETSFDFFNSTGMKSWWIKNGDGYSRSDSDILFCRNSNEIEDAFQRFKEKGVKEAVINRHLEGDLIKFYGVKDSSFFFWFYPFLKDYSKFGNEKVNGNPVKYPVDELQLQITCEKISGLFNVPVYGGDGIIAPDGTISVIDFNDWPSFSPCREKAAHHIAGYIDIQVKKHFSKNPR